jgi:aquaporin Z
MSIKKVAAELLGTFMFFTIGYLSVAAFHSTGSTATPGLLVVPFSFGFGLLAAIFAFGHISGGHFNPAVTLGLVAGGRFSIRDAAPYIAAQVVGAIAAAAVLYVIAHGAKGFDASSSGFAANGFDDHSPGRYSLLACFVSEVTMTAVFMLVIMGATSRRAPAGFAPIAIGLALTLIHLVSIPVTNTSVNPARSTGPALFVGDWALTQLWLFWLAPILGGAIGGLIYKYVVEEEPGVVPAP